MQEKQTEVSEVPILSPLVDIIFRAIFGNPRNSRILSSFIKAVLAIDDADFDSLEITDPCLKVESVNDKSGILDLKVYTKSRKVIHIELQVEPIPEIRERLVFYTSRLAAEQIGRGDSYLQLKKTVSIAILNHVILPENADYHNIFRLYDERTQTQLTDLVEIHTLELKKVGTPRAEQPKGTESKLINWLRFLKATTREEFEMLAQQDNALQEAYEELRRLGQDEETRRQYDKRLMALRDFISRYEGAWNDGQADGIQLTKNIFKHRQAGLSPQEIADKLLLPLEKVQEVLAD